MASTVKKQQSIKTLTNKLDRVFSEYIRLRDSDRNGYCRCISCGKIQYWKDVDCGHYVNRGHMSTRFSERNCNAQCRYCNRFDEGCNIGYTRGLIGKHGIKVLSDLEVKKHSMSKMAAFDYEILINHYIKEVKEMKLNKTLKIN